jgi:hypothetical protein
MISKSLAMGGALVCAMVFNPQVDAAYLGLTTVLHTTVTVDGASRSVYRVYAQFDNPADCVTSVAGSASLGPVVVESRNSTDTGPGSNFYNPGDNTSNSAPSAPNGALEYGTFVTIGVSLSSQGSGPGGLDLTTLSMGFPTFIFGNSLSNNNMSWSTPGETQQGRAGFAGDGDAPLRVLLMQLTVNAGDHVRAVLALAGTHTVSRGSPEGFVFANQQTSSNVPVPGALGLVALSCLIRPRRRS